MRMSTHKVKTPVWTQSDYGEPVATFSDERSTAMFIGWINAMQQELNGAVYEQYEFVGLTRDSHIAEGDIIDDKYIVGRVEPGRIIRVFMNYVEGYNREYVEPTEDNGSTEGTAPEAE